MNEDNDSITTVLNADSQNDFSAQASHVELLFRGRQYSVGREDLPFKIGRDAQSCDLVINSDLVSRNHCSIELRGNQIGLLDNSTNGTCVQVGRGGRQRRRVRVQQLGRGDGLFIRNSFYPLVGQGYIKTGESVDLADPDLILFKVVFKA